MGLIEVSTADDSEPLSLEDAKQHLGISTNDYDTQVAQLIREAREHCERCTQRTLRPSVTRRRIAKCWQDAFKPLRWPPVQSITSISYYDTGGNLLVLSPGSYRLIPSGETVACLEWVSGSQVPSLESRSDAIAVEFVTGYGDAESIPETAKAACKLTLQTLWNEDDAKSTDLAERRAMSLLDGLAVGHYR